PQPADRLPGAAAPGPHAAYRRYLRHAARPLCAHGRVRVHAAEIRGASGRAHPAHRSSQLLHAARAGELDFYSELGFRLTEYTETDGADAELWAVWLQRKGNVHDLAFTNGVGPRLQHVGLWTAGVLDIIHICDVMATSGYLANMERGPGRHG